jgi:hypothetical protein
MKKVRKRISLYLSVLLLIGFSAIFLPLDIFHNHSSIPPVSSTEKNSSSSQQNLNVESKVDFCWVCAVHIDKTFTKASFIERIRLSPIMSVFLNNEVTGYVVELLLASLRGPPSE